MERCATNVNDKKWEQLGPNDLGPLNVYSLSINEKCNLSFYFIFQTLIGSHVQFLMCKLI